MTRLLRWGLLAALLWRVFGPRIQPEFRPPQDHPLLVPGRTVFVGDTEYLVREMGSGQGVPILLIHGLAGASLTEWYQVAPKLAVERWVIMVDNRGHGLSARATRRFEIENVADELAGVLDEMGVGLVDVVGYSFGGTVAQSLAHRHPGRVRKLVLLATFATHTDRDRWMRRVGTVLWQGWERVTGTGTPEIRGGYLIATGAIDKRHRRWIWEENQRRDLESGARATFAMLRFDSTGWVGRLDVPTLVVVPTRDFLVPPAWQYQLAGLIPGAEIVEIADAGHEIVWSHPERVAGELIRFLT